MRPRPNAGETFKIDRSQVLQNFLDSNGCVGVNSTAIVKVKETVII